jgi:predicted lipoprotein with Yx(FWY)xxD motif
MVTSALGDVERLGGGSSIDAVRSLLGVVATSAVLLVSCSGSEPGRTQRAAEPSSPAATPTTSRPASPTANPSASKARPGAVIKTAGSQFGEILFDRDGQAVYLFDREKSTKPECYGECATAWPPVLTEGTPIAVGGAQAGALGTTNRADGSTQVTYRGHPLYYYAHDGRNQVLCHNVREFGGLWLVLTPTGEAAAH